MPFIPTPTETQVSPGKGTSEFKLTLVTAILGAVISIGAALHPGFSINEGSQATITAAGVALMGWVTSWYTHSRAKVKTAALTAGAVAQAAAPSAVTPSPVQSVTTS